MSVTATANASATDASDLTRRPSVDARPVQLLLGIGAAVTVGGVAAGSTALLLAGGALVALGALTVAIVFPMAFVLVFVAVRPLLDVGTTYGRGPDINTPAGALLLVAIGTWAFRHRRTIVRPSASVWAAWLFGAAGALSVLGSRDPAQSISMELRLITIVALFSFAEQFARRAPSFVRNLVAATLLSAVGAGAVALLQIANVVPLPIEYTGGEILRDSLRPPGPYPAATVLATHMFIAIGLLLFALPKSWPSLRWRGAVPHLLLMGGAIAWIMLENKSRGASIGILIAISVVTTIRWRWIGVAISIMLILGGVATLDASSTRINEVGSGSVPGAEADTLQWRVAYWKANLPRVADSPITGIGLGRVEQLNNGKLPPHNSAVQSIVEMGIFGAVTYLAFVALLGRDLLRALRRARHTAEWEFVIVVAALCLGYLWIGLFDNVLTLVVTSGPMALLAGTALGRVNAEAFT